MFDTETYNLGVSDEKARINEIIINMRCYCDEDNGYTCDKCRIYNEINE